MIVDQVRRVKSARRRRKHFIAQINRHDLEVVFIPASPVVPADTGRRRRGRVLESAVELLNAETGAKLVKGNPRVELLQVNINRPIVQFWSAALQVW